MDSRESLSLAGIVSCLFSFPLGFADAVFPFSPCRLGLFSAEVRFSGNGVALHTVYISCCGRVSHYIQCIFHVEDVFGVTYSVYFMLRTCLALHTVYISCCGRVWHYIQCIFCVANVFGITYSVYFVLRMCLALHTVYILSRRSV